MVPVCERFVLMCLFFSIYRHKLTFMKLKWNTLCVASIYIVLVLTVYIAPHPGTNIVCIYVAVRDQRVLYPCNESWFTIAESKARQVSLLAAEVVHVCLHV